MSAKLREKVNSREFTITTTQTPEQIQQTGARCAAAEKRTMGSSVREVNVGPAHISYEIKGPGGLKTFMDMTLDIQDEGAARKVSFEIGEFVFTRPTMFFIPIGPATTPAMKTLDRFASRLRAELSS